MVSASLWGLLAGRPVPLAYLVFFGLVALGSAALLLLDRSDRLDAPARS